MYPPVSSLTGARQQSLEFAAVSPSVTRSQSPALGISPMVRDRVHSFDGRSRGRLSLPPTAADTRSASTDRQRDTARSGGDGVRVQKRAVTTITVPRLERAKKEADISSLLTTPSKRERSRSPSGDERSSGGGDSPHILLSPPSKRERSRSPSGGDKPGRGSNRDSRLERSQTLPEDGSSRRSDLLPRPITITTGESGFSLIVSMLLLAGGIRFYIVCN